MEAIRDSVSAYNVLAMRTLTIWLEDEDETLRWAGATAFDLTTLKRQAVTEARQVGAECVRVFSHCKQYLIFVEVFAGGELSVETDDRLVNVLTPFELPVTPVFEEVGRVEDSELARLEAELDELERDD